MKKILYTAIFAALFAAGCQDDDYPDLLYPQDQEFPTTDAEYIPGSSDGLTTSATQVMLPTSNAKTYYVDGSNPGAETTVCYSGQEIGRILDGEAKVQAPANQWQITQTSPGADPTATAVDVVVEIPAGTSFDYMMFVNRNWGNGVPWIFEWFISKTDAPDNFISQGDIQQVANLGSPANPGNTADYNAYAHKIDIPPALAGNVAKVKIRIEFGKCQSGTAICIRELEFWKNGDMASIPGCFTDRSCSVLKGGTTQQEIDNIESSFFKNLAQALYDGVYDESRVISAVPMAEPSEISGENKTNFPYSKLHYPTGIYADAGENLIVFAEGVSGDAVLSVFGKNKATAAALLSVKLQNGINTIPSESAGTVYITNTDPAQTSLKVNVANGYMNGIWDVSKNHAPQLPFILSRARRTDNIDLIGKAAMLTVDISDFEKYCKDPNELLAVYDEMAGFQQEFAGMVKNTTKLHYVETTGRGNMMFVANWGEFNPNHMNYMLDPAMLKENLTEVAQITAQTNVPRGFTWASVNTAPANRYLFAAATQEHLGVPSHFAAAPETFAEAFGHYFINGETHAGSNVARLGKVNAVHLWQLHLYMSQVKGMRNFYTEVLGTLREGTANTALNFAKVACETGRTNFTEFFNKWGYNLPADFETAQISPGTAANIPAQAIEYISDATVSLYRNPAAVSVAASGYTLSDENEFSFDFSGCRNVAAYEVVMDGNPVYISAKDKFEFTAVPGTTVTANAIGTYGIKVPVTVTRIPQ